MEEEDKDSSVEYVESSAEEADSEEDPWRTDDVDLFTFVPDPDPVYGGRGYWIQVEAEVAAARRAEAAGEAAPARTILRAMPVGVVEPAADAAAAAESWRAPLADDHEPSEPGSEPEPDAAKIESEESEDPEKEPAFGRAAAWLAQPKKEDEEMEDGAEIPVPVKACQTDPPSTL